MSLFVVKDVSTSRLAPLLDYSFRSLCADTINSKILGRVWITQVS